MKYLSVIIITVLALGISSCSHGVPEDTRSENTTQSGTSEREAINAIQSSVETSETNIQSEEVSEELIISTEKTLPETGENQNSVEISIDESASPEEAAALEEIESLFNEILES